MQVRLEPQGKVVELAGRRRVADVLRTLDVIPGTVLVIRGDALLTEDAFLEADDAVELRAVISGGLS